MSDKFLSVIEFFFTQIKIIRGVVYANRQNLIEQTLPVTITSQASPQKVLLPEQPADENALSYNTPGDSDKHFTLPRVPLGNSVLQSGEGITWDIPYVENVRGFFMSFVRITLKGDADGSATLNDIKNRFYKNSRDPGSIRIEKEFFSMYWIHNTINGSRKPSQGQKPPVITPPAVDVLPPLETTPGKTIFVYNAGEGDKHLELQPGSGNTNTLKFGQGITADMLHFEIDGFIHGSLKIIIKGHGSVTMDENRNGAYSGSYWLDGIEVDGKSFPMDPIRDTVQAGKQPWSDKEPPVITPPAVDVLPPSETAPGKTIFVYNAGEGDKHLELQPGSGNRNTLKFGKDITRDMLHFEIDGFINGSLKIIIKGHGSVTVDENRNSKYSGAYYLGSIEVDGESFSMYPIRDAIRQGRQPWSDKEPPVIAPPVVTPEPPVQIPQPTVPSENIFTYNLGDGDKKFALSDYSRGRNVLLLGKGITRNMLHFEIDGFIYGSVTITIQGSGSATFDENRNGFFRGAYWLDRLVVEGESFSMNQIRDSIQAGKQPWSDKEPPVIAPPVVEVLPPPDPIPPVVITPVEPIDPRVARVMKMIGAHQYKWEKNGQAERKLTYSFNKYSPLQLADYLKKYYPHVYESEMKDNLDDYKSLKLFSAENALRQMVRNILSDLQTKIGLEFEEREDEEGVEADTDLRFLTYDVAEGDTGDYDSGLTCMLTEDNQKTSIIMIREGRVSEGLVSHEIGHGLGLLHPSRDSQYNYLTIMQSRFYAQEFTAADLAVLKEKYGHDVIHQSVPPADKLASTDVLMGIMSGMPGDLQAPLAITQYNAANTPVSSYLAQPA